MSEVRGFESSIDLTQAPDLIFFSTTSFGISECLKKELPMHRMGNTVLDVG